MKRSRLSYDNWKCILSKKFTCNHFDNTAFKGYISLIDFLDVNESQTWRFDGEDIVICEKGLKWLSILPENEFYCITAMLDNNNEVILWYIDMLAEQGIDNDNIPYFYDLYLDLVVFPNGTIKVDDMNELQDALHNHDISQQQFNLALETSDKLKNGLISNINCFTDFTRKCLAMIVR